MRTYYVPEIDLLLVNRRTPPELRLSVVVIERWGLFCGHHIMLDERWLSRDNYPAVVRLARILRAECAGYNLGRWVVTHFPPARHPGYIPLTEWGLTLWTLEAWQTRPQAAG